MAKDKGDKPKKDKTATVATSAFAKPSEAPAGGDGWNLTDADGKLLLLTPLRTIEVDDKYHAGSKKEVVVADVVVINEDKPEKSEEHLDVYVFQGYLKGSLKGYIGEQKVLARLGMSTRNDPKSGKPFWEFSDANDDDIANATAYLASLDPFAQTAADKAKGKKNK